MKRAMIAGAVLPLAALASCGGNNQHEAIPYIVYNSVGSENPQAPDWESDPATGIRVRDFTAKYSEKDTIVYQGSEFLGDDGKSVDIVVSFNDYQTGIDYFDVTCHADGTLTTYTSMYDVNTGPESYDKLVV